MVTWRARQRRGCGTHLVPLQKKKKARTRAGSKKKKKRSTCQAEGHRTGDRINCFNWMSVYSLANGKGVDLASQVGKADLHRRDRQQGPNTASGAVLSVSRHSAELGFTLIKEGLPKSAGSS